MACTGTLATATDFADFFCLGTLTAAQIASINNFLAIASADAFSVMAAANACSCTLDAWAVAFLKKLTVIDAAVIHNCPCGSAKLSDELKQMWLRWLTEQYTAIRTGALELCSGATGSDWPAVGNAQYSWTDWNAAQIILNTEAKNTP